MKAIVKGLRSFISTILRFLLSIILVLTIPVCALSLTFINRNNLKNAFELTNTYEKFTPALLNLIEQQYENSSTEKTDQSDTTQGSPETTQSQDTTNNTNIYPEIIFSQLTREDSETRRTFEQFMKKELLKRATEKVIDAFYDYFEGKTRQPEFEINLIDSKETLTNILKAAVNDKFDEIPVCNLDYTTTNEFNPFEAECRPENITDKDVDDFIAQFLTDEKYNEIYATTTIKSENLNIPKKETENIKVIFTTLKAIPVYTFVVTILFASLIIVTTPTFKTKFSRLGGTLLTSGIILTLIHIFINKNWNRIDIFISDKLAIDNNSFIQTIKRIVLPITDNLFNQFLSNFTILNFSLITIGIGFIIFGIFFKKEVLMNTTKTKKEKDYDYNDENDDDDNDSNTS
ncbi:hypothetical protein JW887_01270 [Candidatus Dojkabacteria bacterium]|nr:hypothetical protein [Candidatus Dojkabacteria bacterium]